MSVVKAIEHQQEPVSSVVMIKYLMERTANALQGSLKKVEYVQVSKITRGMSQKISYASSPHD